ncbi:hypothetical protein B0T26DRAFT_746786 [Lasiosphaeria miniovina]|uniref:Uncharacterized protein n=1 Tax=Lasiosphaeria miniovina TaxID=1954250 RepID=A0AA40EGR3_9PEZI|nr:uncharacterized protein B0T26DRAFT_746786 [Lasiosphaeria miniovina]KAK0734943.1 hypothetical protein B0T26DRAFT_746786 [Lasiosphaeria miniovina]
MASSESNKPKLPTWLQLQIAANSIFRRSRTANEIAAMRFVRNNTTIPVPRLVDVDLDKMLHTLSDENIATIAEELAGYVTQLQQLDTDKDVASDGKITGIIDWQFAGWYPQYWEYVKLQTTLHTSNSPSTVKWLRAVNKAFQKYELEAEASKRIFERGGISPDGERDSRAKMLSRLK